MNTEPVEFQKLSIAELKAMTNKQRGEYLASLAVQALRENTKDLPEPTAEQKQAD